MGFRKENSYKIKNEAVRSLLNKFKGGIFEDNIIKTYHGYWKADIFGKEISYVEGTSCA